MIESDRTATTINLLPDDVLFNILDLYQKTSNVVQIASWNWHVLRQVCRRWQQIIFSHPHSLNVKLHISDGDPARQMLDRWPTMLVDVSYANLSQRDEDSIHASFENPSRVCSVTLSLSSHLLAKITAMMQKPFPALRTLVLLPYNGNIPALSDGFLAGSAPRLEVLFLSGIPFPALQTFLSSASNLVRLELLNTPKTTSISPEALVACLTIMHKLNDLIIEFPWPTFRPSQLLLPETRVPLDSIQVIKLTGSSVYLEDLVARIDAPQLKKFSINYLDQPNFEVSQMFSFINRLNCKIFQFGNAGVYFDVPPYDISFAFLEEDSLEGSHFMLENAVSLYIPGDGIEQQVSHMTQVLRHTSARLADVVHLEIAADGLEYNHQDWDNIEESVWLNLLLPFTAMETLCVVGDQLPGIIVPALEGITEEMGIELLPCSY